ncbi:MAG: hypothetical protein OEZ39_19755 [Gammaproteobacteria bacterium]|nr:hypothetical protein [Gammaproteobacteria bacterium]MDH5654103.1 hypothetical protein [Gammaproteobacteria bacterium]
MQRSTYHIIALLLFTFLIAGCSMLSGDKVYKSPVADNMFVKTQIDDAADTRITVSIKKMSKSCNESNQGDLALPNGDTAFGLWPGQLYSLTVTADSKRLGGYQQRSTLLRPKPSQAYAALVRYQNNKFDVKFYKQTSAGNQELGLLPLSACKHVQ